MPPEALELDSDSDTGSDYSVTQTQLAITDGPLEKQDETNPLVSRLGGKPAWLPSKTIPPMSVSICVHCQQHMELLVQIFAPLDQSPYDRLLLVWGCARRPCQQKGKGSIRAIRVLTYNARWAAKLERKRKRQEEKDARLRRIEEENAKAEKEEAAKSKSNPFSTGASKGAMFGGGLFGGSDEGPAAVATANVKEEEEINEAHSSDESESEDDQLAEEMAIKASLEKTQREKPDWSADAPAYLPAQYLNTYAEPSSSARAYEESKESKKQLKQLKESGGIGEMKGWEAERYESMMVSGMDDIFERFIKRVSPNGKQVVRYEFDGIPLPFHGNGLTYDRLWPKKQTKERAFSTSGVAPCPLCGSQRVFEMQLMPNLVNTLRSDSIVGGQQGDAGEEEKDAELRKKREIEEALGHKIPDQPDADGITRSKPAPVEQAADSNKLPLRSGLHWSTAMVFVCKEDCHGKNASGTGEVWSEEEVLLQFEHES